MASFIAQCCVPGNRILNPNTVLANECQQRTGNRTAGFSWNNTDKMCTSQIEFIIEFLDINTGAVLDTEITGSQQLDNET